MTNVDPKLYFLLFYLALAIMFLGMAIIVYPTLRSSSKKR